MAALPHSMDKSEGSLHMLIGVRGALGVLGTCPIVTNMQTHTRVYPSQSFVTMWSSSLLSAYVGLLGIRLSELLI